MRRWQREASDDPDAFWARAAEALPWFSKWDQVFDWQPPTFRWFIGGETNLAYNCLDQHVKNGRGGQAALVALDERGERRVYTYAQLLHEVKRASAALRGLGIGKGDRVAIYMPTCPEAIIIMLACLRIGAIHLVVFAGFGANALAERMRLAGAKALFASDITYRRGKEVDLLGIVDRRAVRGRRPSSSTSSSSAAQRRRCPMPGRDITWDDFLARGEGQGGGHVAMESNEPAFILATSGTTAKPKLAVHTPRRLPGLHPRDGQLDVRPAPDDVWWSTSDIGWIVGHSYIVYAPLLVGCTTLAFEGAIDYPSPETFYRIIEANRVSGMFTSPTAVRLLMRYGAEAARRHDLSSLERVFCAGEVLNPPAWEWLQTAGVRRPHPGHRPHVADRDRRPDRRQPLRPRACCRSSRAPPGIPLPGIEAVVVDAGRRAVRPGEKGIFVIKRPFPGLTATLWGEPERYGPTTGSACPASLYFTGDAADRRGRLRLVQRPRRRDHQDRRPPHRHHRGRDRVPAPPRRRRGGRHRAAPTSCAGEVIAAFVVLKHGHEPSSTLRDEILATVRRELGPSPSSAS